MEKKANTAVVGLVVAVVAFMGFIGCGFFCFTLSQSLGLQRHELADTRAQLSMLNKAMELQQRDLADARAQLAAAKQQIADARKANPSLARQSPEIRPKSQPIRTASVAPLPPMQVPAAPADVPGPDSVEGALQAEGKNWERTQGQLVAGGYALDILPGRLNQPQGRGRLGKVVSVAANGEGQPVATVDFGRGYIIGIAGSELAPVRVLGPDVR